MRTLRVAFVAAGLGFLVLTGAAQSQMKHDWGVTAGLNLATFAGKDSNDFSKRYDFMLGLSHLHSINANFALQPELLYSRQGSKFKDNFFQVALKLGYIELPVLAKIPFSMSNTSVAKPAVYFGPYAGLNISCDVESTYLGATHKGKCDEFELKAKKFDFGLVGGLGVDYGNFNAFARYSYGLISVDNSATDRQDAKNRVITLGGRWSIATMK